MPGYLLHAGATVQCGHGGTVAVLAPAQSRVTVAGQPVLVSADLFNVSTCSLVTAGQTKQCLTGQWMGMAGRVTAGGQPVLLQSAPSGTAAAVTDGVPPAPPVLVSMQQTVTGS